MQKNLLFKKAIEGSPPQFLGIVGKGQWSEAAFGVGHKTVHHSRSNVEAMLAKVSRLMCSRQDMSRSGGSKAVQREVLSHLSYVRSALDAALASFS